MTDAALPAPRAPALGATGTTFAIIYAVSFCHFLNDILQSLLAALYPMLKEDFRLSFGQIGLLTLAFQVTASLLQPAVGLVTDKRPLPRSLPFGMASSLVGLVTLAFAPSYGWLLLGAALIGLGSAVFHPEASRVARAASGGRFGFAQSTFQVGGNFGHAAGPLLAAFIVVPRGQASVAWFTLAALLGIVILWRVSDWYAHASRLAPKRPPAGPRAISRNRILVALAILVVLTFSKNVYTAAISSYYTFYAIERFGVSVQASQLMLFAFLGASAVGVFLGGPAGDRWGSKAVIAFSVLGVLPFTLALPYAASLPVAVALTVLIGLIISSAFPAIIVFAQELVPGRVGLVAGIFFGFAFGTGGIAAAALGVLADARGIEWVFSLCSFLPALGLLALVLPAMRPAAR